MTVLFADLSGYTAVAEHMDPEVVKGMVDGALRRLAREVELYGGSVDKFIGDNVMALFGAPVAHEDDAERAVRAGLGMQAAMAEVNEGLPPDTQFALRVGVNTGEVLAGAVAGESYTVVGDTVNVASRLQAAARPGTVTVGDATMHATRGAISYLPLEPLALRGRSEPVRAWEAVEPISDPGLRRPPAVGETPLVDRESELAALRAVWDRLVHERTAHLAMLIGEPGVGKSRLFAELERRLVGPDASATVRSGRCPPYGSGVVFWALAEIVRSECGIAASDSAEAAWRKLGASMGRLAAAEPVPGESPESRAALIGWMLGIEVPAELAPTDRDPERLRDRFLEALRWMVEAMARRAPLVLAFEDVHWADDGMLDAIEHLARWVRAPVLLLCLARQELLERRPGWGAGPLLSTRLRLEPLPPALARRFVSTLLPASTNGSGDELVSQLAERSGGNPLFAEEIVRMVGEEHPSGADLPETVQAVLATRLDALPPFERRVVQHAAIAGRVSVEGWLARLGADARDLELAVADLEAKGILAPVAGGQAGERELAFKHVLVREVAYGQLPRSTRSRLHAALGEFIEERAGDRIEEVLPLLAEHYGRAARMGAVAGLPDAELAPVRERALRCREGAGDAAARLYSNREAAAHYRGALELAASQPDARARIAERLGDVSLRLGQVDSALTVWRSTHDYHRGRQDAVAMARLHRKMGAALSHKAERAAAVEQYQRGIALLRDGPPRLELVRLYEEAAWLSLYAGDNHLAIYASEKALGLAERLGEAGLASRAHGIIGRVFGRLGDNERARTNLERAVELAEDSHPGEAILALLALGRQLETAESALTAAGEAYATALRRAEQLGYLPVQTELHAALAQLAIYRADWATAEAETERTAELGEREGLVGKLSLLYVLRASLAWREGDMRAAAELSRRAGEIADGVGWLEVAFQALFGLAEVLWDTGEPEAALAALDRAQERCERAGLVTQLIQTKAGRAVALALSGRPEAAGAAASDAAGRAEQ
ncbi:MAG: adenylate/guanylate cyclase domain-containing protein, partial [Nocardioidaceae bacterium]